MSFGFSISDIITLTKLTTRTYNGWKKACGEYASITCDLDVLQTLLMRVEAEAKAPNSLFARNPDNLRGWRTLYKSCRSLIAELEEILNKYKSLGTSRRRNWDRIRMSNKNLDSLSIQLVKRTASLSAFVSVLGISSQGRLENEVFPELLQRMDHIAAQIKNGNASSSTALTAYDSDDKAVWREFRRDMINAGIRSGDIHKYSAALKTYLARLQREGLLDEEGSPDTNMNSACIQPLASPSSYSENDSQPPTKELKQIQRDTDGIQYTGYRFNETKDHNSTNADRKLKEAEELKVQRMESRKRVLGLEHVDTLSTMHSLAFIYFSQKRWNDAEKLVVQVMESQKRVLGLEHKDTLSTMHNLAFIYFIQERWNDAEELGVQVMESRKRVLGPDHQHTLITMRNLVLVYMRQLQWNKAEELEVQMVESRKRVLGPEHKDTLSIMHRLSLTYEIQGQLNEAGELIAQVIEIGKRVLGPEHIETLYAMRNLALVYWSQKRLDEAEELIAQVIEIRKRVLGLEHIETLTAMHNLYFIYMCQKRFKEANELGVQVLEILKRVLGPNHKNALVFMQHLTLPKS
ncbi:hypothetical protein N0V90_002423 [Kalmusia sp. IMI 367209]|nr:hypothetical protein N0V90_002423 [Kalmusia sp. IMI 367209]